MKSKRGRSAFTFLEIMLVVVIIGILFGIVGVNLSKKSRKARESATKQQMQNIATALELYEMNIGELPSNTVKFSLVT